jgi:ABC-type proline/glycine betaine transport system substrate-binding protein
VKLLVTIPPSTIDVRAPFLVFTTFFVMNRFIKACTCASVTVDLGLLNSIEAVFPFSQPKTNLKTVALDKGEVDVAMVYSTDGLLKKYNLYVLEDDLSFFPIYNPALCIRKEVLDKYPDIPKALEPLTKTLTTEDIINLNYLVDVEGKDHEAVAKTYLQEKGLIK